MEKPRGENCGDQLALNLDLPPAGGPAPALEDVGSDDHRATEVEGLQSPPDGLSSDLRSADLGMEAMF